MVEYKTMCIRIIKQITGICTCICMVTHFDFVHSHDSKFHRELKKELYAICLGKICSVNRHLKKLKQ